MNDPRTAGEQGLLRPFLAMTGVAPDTTATIGGIVTDQIKLSINLEEMKKLVGKNI